MAFIQPLGFALLQARERRRLADGAHVHDPAPADRALTSVVRLPPAPAEAAANAAAALPGIDAHRLYPQERLHLTVLNLGHPADDPGRTDTAARILAAAPAFPVVLRGLGVSRWSLYARAYDPTGTLRTVRRRLAGALDLHPPPRLRLLGFVTLARFGAPDLTSLAAAVGRAPTTDLGRFTSTTVEIVRTDRLFAPAATTVLRRVELRGS